MTNILAQKAVLASVKISQWQGRRVDKRVTEEVNREHGADSDAGRYWKRLLEKGAMKEVGSAITTARNYHYQKTLPWYDQGARLLPSKLYLDYQNDMREIRDAFEAASRKFIDEYPSAVRKAKAALNGLFNPADYPAQNELRGMFKLESIIAPCPDTDDFRIAVGSEHAEDIRLDLERRMKETTQAALRDAAERAHDRLVTMLEKLRAYKPATDDANAEGTFRNSLVENVREIANILPAFNLTDDPKLTKITRRIKNELCAHDADTLREDEAQREIVAKSAEKILDEISDYMA